MNIDRFKRLWKLFCSMYAAEDFGHCFYNGASLDSKVYYVNEAANIMGMGPVSKQEIKETLAMACERGWATKVPKLHCEEDGPSKYIFIKGY